MKKSIFISLIFLLMILVSCENESPVVTLAEKGSVSLSFSAEALHKSLNKTSSVILSNVVVDIENSAGTLVYSNKIIRLIKMGEEYVSEPISLDAETHKLQKFLIADRNDVVVYATPVAGSKTAHLVNNPLAISFDIIADQTKKIVPEVVNVSNLSASDFGYATFGFNTVNAITPKISVFTYNDATLNYELTTAELKVFRGSDEITGDNLIDSTNTVILRDEGTDYTFLIQKSGFNAYINKFSIAELVAFSSNPLEVILTENNEDSFTKLFITGEGIHGQSILFDDSPLVRTFDTFGAIADTSVKKNGTYSVYFDGTYDYLSIPDSEDFNFGSGDFTIDFWINFSSIKTDGWAGIFSQRIIPDNDNSLSLFYKMVNSPQNVWVIHLTNPDGSAWVKYQSESITPALNTWHHIAVVRKGDVLKFYYDGVSKITVNLTPGQALYNSTQPLIIGAANGGGVINHHFNGHIDDFRVSKGIARWDTDFTP